MYLIMRTELTDLTDAELATLLAQISRDVLRVQPLGLQWQNGMMSLDNIRREQAIRRERARHPELLSPTPKPRPRGPGF